MCGASIIIEALPPIGIQHGLHDGAVLLQARHAAAAHQKYARMGVQPWLSATTEASTVPSLTRQGGTGKLSARAAFGKFVLCFMRHLFVYMPMKKSAIFAKKAEIAESSGVVQCFFADLLLN